MKYNCVLFSTVLLLAVLFSCRSAPQTPQADMWSMLAQGDERARDFFLGEFDVHSTDSAGRTPLHYAADQDNAVFAGFFIALGANPNARDSSGHTPLGVCAEKNAVNAAEVIARAGADIHMPSNSGLSPARAALRMNNDRFLHAILTPANHNSTDNDGKTILHIASELGNITAVKTILDAIDSNHEQERLVSAGSRNNPLDLRDANGHNPLDIAFSRPDSQNHMEVAELLILSGAISDNAINEFFAPAARNANYNFRNASGMAVLHFAARNAHEGLISFLLTKNSNVNIRDASGITPLHEAVRSGHTNIISLLLRSGADINARDAKENTALHIAAPSNTHASVIRLLLQNNANPNLRDEFGDTPLHVLITLNRDPETVQALLGGNVDITVRNMKGQTPLHHAVQENRLSLIPLLIQARSNVFAADNAGITPFDKAMERRGSILDALITPLTAQQTDSSGNTMLHIAISNRADILTIEKILSHNVQVNARNREGDTALHIAARENHREAGTYILSTGSADIFSYNSSDESPLRIALTHSQGVLPWMFTPQTVGSRDGMGNTMLHYVAEWKYDRHISFIVQNGVHTEAVNAIGETPLFASAKHDGVSTIHTLLATNANLHARDSTGNSALHSAVRWNAQNAVHALINEGIDVNTHNLNGTTPLHDSVSLGLTNIAVILLNQGAQLEVRDTGGNTPFMIAVRSGFLSSVELLASFNANPMTRNINGDTPLHYAVQMENAPMIQTLLDLNASIHARNTRNRTPFQIALRQAPGTLPALLTRTRINSPDDFGNSPLHVALQERVSPDTLRIVISRGTDLNNVDSNGRIPLRLAVDMDEWEYAGILANAGSNPFSTAVDNRTPAEVTIARGEDPIRAVFSGPAINRIDGSGNTVLHYAARMGRPDSISLLLELGANRTIRNISSESPADVAIRWNNRENAALLN